jgi:hypothetical protein
VQTHAHAHLGAVGPPVVGELTLGDDGRRKCRFGASEGEEKGVTLAVDLASLAPFGSVSQYPLVLGEDVSLTVP